MYVHLHCAIYLRSYRYTSPSPHNFPQYGYAPGHSFAADFPRAEAVRIAMAVSTALHLLLDARALSAVGVP
jgi:hypothetical protein